MKIRERFLSAFHLATTLIWSVRCELINLFFCFGYNAPFTFVENMVIQKVCVQKGISGEYCAGDRINATIEATLQEEASRLILYHYMLRQLPAVALSLFAGPWSDHYGRKWVMVASSAGCVVTAGLYWLNARFVDWSPIYVVLSALPAGVSGDYNVFQLALFGYVRDSFPVASVSVRVAFVQGVDVFTYLIGPLVAGQLDFRFGYAGVHCACVVAFASAIALTLVFVKDDRFKKDQKSSTAFRDFFRTSGLTSCLDVVRRKREGHARAYVICVLVASFCLTMQNYGFVEISYLYARLKVQWEATTMNYFTAANAGLKAIGCFVVLPVLIKVLHWSEATITILGIFALVAFQLILAFANTTLAFFTVIVLQVLGVSTFVTTRSLVMKSVGVEEVGGAMGVYALLQALAQSSGQAIATQLYNATYRLFPGAYFLASCSLTLISLALFSWIRIDLSKRKSNFEEIDRLKS